MSACSLELTGDGFGDAFVTDSGLPDAGVDADLDGGLSEAAVFPDANETSDAALPCDDVPSGASQTRVRWQAAEVRASEPCREEEQQRGCTNGVWSAWSGTYQAEQCTVAEYRSCGALLHGGSERRMRYSTALVTNYQDCISEEQVRTCNDGTLSEWTGTFGADSCAVQFLGVCNVSAVVLGSNETCEPGTLCDVISLGMDRCRGQSGHLCSANSECVHDLVCVDGLCGTRSLASGSCDAMDDCSRLACVPAAIAPISVACIAETCQCSNNARCSANSDCQGTCVSERCVDSNTTCDESDGDADCRNGYVCRPTSKAGRRCVIPDGQMCTNNGQCTTVCRTGRCTGLGESADTCDENDDCRAPLVCRSGTCAERGTLGQPCDERGDCGNVAPYGQLACADFNSGGGVSVKLCLVDRNMPCMNGADCASGVCRTISNDAGGTTMTCQ